MVSSSEFQPNGAFVSHVQNRAGSSFTVVTDLNGAFSGSPMLLTRLHEPCSPADFVFDRPALCGHAPVVLRLLGTPRLPF